MKIKELLTDKSKWCQRAMACDKDNGIVGVENPDACKWCLLGAIHKCYPDNIREIQERIYRKIGIGSIIKFNDTHVFGDIKNLVEGLDI